MVVSYCLMNEILVVVESGMMDIGVDLIVGAKVHVHYGVAFRL